MKRLSPLCFAFCLLTSSQAFSTPLQEASPLDRASRTFAAADTSRDGELDRAEIAKASIPSSALTTWDKDRDGALSKDEFLVYYRQLMVNAGLKPGAELDREIARIEKLRVARERERARQQARAEQRLKAEQNANESIADKYRRAQQALNERARNTGASQQAIDQAQARLSSRARSAAGGTGGSSSDSGRELGAGASIRERLRVAQQALENRGKSAGASQDQIDKANAQLVQRAQAAEDKRKAGQQGSGAAAGGQKPPQKDASVQRADLQKSEQSKAASAKVSAAGQSTSGASPQTIAQRAEQAKAAAAKRADVTGASAQQLAQAQARIDQRAQAAVKQNKQPDADVASLPSTVRQQLNVALAELETRSKGAGWTKQQYETARAQMIQRAVAKHRGVPAGSVPSGDQSAKSKDKARQTTATEAKAGAQKPAADGTKREAQSADAKKKGATPPATDSSKNGARKSLKGQPVEAKGAKAQNKKVKGSGDQKRKDG